VAGGDPSVIPWADQAPNPNLVEWLERRGFTGSGKKALKVGCGLGDYAEELARRGFETTAFDVSCTAIRWCLSRFPDSRVNYLVADLFSAPTSWNRAFDLVVEAYTLQVLPPRIRRTAMGHIADFVGPRGTLLVIARARKETDDEGEMPWPLTLRELATFQTQGLSEAVLEDFVDHEAPPVRRVRATYLRN
jgi:ubiquinone/menaquinone biosynthesis C-methylase UbiE